MGIIHVDGLARGPQGEASVRFLVDSGATYTVLPPEIWRGIGLIPRRTVTFSLADGTTIDRTVSECYFILPQGEGTSPVVLGEPGDYALLGVFTLEVLGLVLNPFTRELQPMRLLLV